MATEDADLDFQAAVAVAFAEDVSFGDASPLLDALAASPIYSVRSTRVATSGPMSEGTAEFAVIVQVALGTGAVLFAKKFLELLAEDTYAAARKALRALVERLRARGPRQTRSASALAIDVGLRFDFGPYLAEESPIWSDEELKAMLLAAQAILDQTDLSQLPIARWESIDAFTARPGLGWDPQQSRWVLNEALVVALNDMPRDIDG